MRSNASEVIRDLDNYKEKIGKRVEELVSQLVDEGKAEAQSNLDSAEYAGRLKSRITGEAKGKTGAVSLEGYDAGFIEFGTGTHYPDDHPLSGELGVPERGSFGKHYGLNPPWTFIGDATGTTGEVIGVARAGVVIETYGNPANRVIYNTGKELEKRALKIAKEVFDD